MAKDATLSRRVVMTTRSYISGRVDMSMVTVTLKESDGTHKGTPSRHLSVQVVRCILYVHSRRPIGGAIHHRHTQP